MVISNEEYFTLLDYLEIRCNQARIIEDEDSNFQSLLKRHSTNEIWTKTFPGHSGGKCFKVVSYDVSETFLRKFKAYNSFFELDGENTDLDIAFYYNNELVFWVISHEELCILEDCYINEYCEYANNQKCL